MWVDKKRDGVGEEDDNVSSLVAPLPKVLVVDDDAMNVEVMTSMLLNQGYYSNSSLSGA